MGSEMFVGVYVYARDVQELGTRSVYEGAGTGSEKDRFELSKTDVNEGRGPHDVWNVEPVDDESNESSTP